MPDHTEKTGEKAGRKALLKLLRMLLRGECRIVAENMRAVRLERQGEGADFNPAMLAFGVSRGLVMRRDQTIAATPAASAFLRRALADGEAEFAGQHRDMVEETALVEGARQRVSRNLKESPLAPLARLKDRGGEPFLSVAAFDAGERLAADFTRAQMQPRITASWEPRLETGGGRRGAGGTEISDSAMAARDRFARAVEAMGPELSGVAMDVCCFSKGLEVVERERSWPARSAKLMLRAALLALARHYAPPVAEGRRRHHWGDGDFRPRM
ncbi:hypothetical protein GAO09_15665 [Rhizobiales bacterium RZME27]|uniref:DUF6456 domain-containing protein n=1 Tax=Endobacterium cereale TaxID=2663029 RepID=A0A6A8AFE6_9HYPH|nr:DUF6456 domain-containing protein [Endobacterium cereale]MEB2847112.1 DUF6456 domain-containing protein [Endobacterium cereale]MQY47471.1 hypothetical protein [Endobacterium cereale]